MRTSQRLLLHVFALSVLLLMAGWLSAKPVQADPHGVFFTVVGQQQIFFNILAALNQADYVEPLQLRQQLAQGRDAAGYVPSASRPLAETATQLADVLTRSVSLEGQDVRTQERSDEYAREVVRQQRVAELIKQLCQEAFGAKDCTGDVEPQPLGALGVPLTGREQSFIQDPVTRSKLPYILGVLGALSSGTEAHKNLAEKLVQEAKRGGAVLPLEYSPVIAAWRETASGEEVEALDRALIKKAASFLSSEVDQSFWERITVENGKAEVNIQTSDSTAQKTEKYFLAMQELLAVPNSIEDIAAEAEERVRLQLESTIVDGAVPDLESVPEGERVSTIVRSPANVKVGLQQQLLLLLAQLEGSPEFADPSQIDNPGGVSAIEREGEEPLKIGAPLTALQKTKLIDEGLLSNTGVKPLPGLNKFFLRKFIDECLVNLCLDLKKKP